MIDLNTKNRVNYNVWVDIFNDVRENDLNYAKVNVTNVVWKNVWHNVWDKVLNNVFEDLRNHTKQI